MSDPLDALIGTGALPASPFAPNSRYSGVELARITLQDGHSVSYVRRRFAPQPERFSTLVEHTVVGGDRLDNIAWQHFGDAELYWRLCDANRALDPDELTDQPGRRLLVTLPEGMAGGDDA